MNFSHYFNLILEEKDLSKLPEEPPYGFWIAPNQEFYVTNNHLSTGVQLERKFDIESKSLGTYANLYNHGFIRIGTDYLSPNLRYELDYNNAVNSKTLKLAKDIIKYYNHEIVIHNVN